MAEVYQIFSVVFWKINDFINTFWHYRAEICQKFWLFFWKHFDTPISFWNYLTFIFWTCSTPNVTSPGRLNFRKCIGHVLLSAEPELETRMLFLCVLVCKHSLHILILYVLFIKLNILMLALLNNLAVSSVMTLLDCIFCVYCVD